MNCKLCGDAITDFMFRGTCAKCIDLFITSAMKAKQRAAMVPEVASETVTVIVNASGEAETA